MKKRSASRELARLCCRALDGKKAEGLRVLDVSEHSSITDYLVIATGTSEPHLRALRDEIEKTLDEARTRVVGREAAQESGWLVVDAFDVMIHLFTQEQRDHYRLEQLWKDAEEISLQELLAEPKRPARAKPASKPARRAAPAKPRAPKRRKS